MNDDALKQQLLSSGALDPTTLEQAEAFAKSRRRPLAASILELGLMPEPDLYKHAAKAHHMSFVDPGNARIPQHLLDRIPRERALQARALPVKDHNGTLLMAVDDPDRVFVLDDLGFLAGGEVRGVLAPPSSLQKALERSYGSLEDDARPQTPAAAALGDDDDAPIIRLVHKTIEQALEMRASDIHVEPFESRVRIRYRIDGVLKEVASHAKGLQGPLVSRLKIMAALDIAEKRKPQDGRIAFRASGRDIDIRASVLPGNHGESMVLRLLDKEKGLASLDQLGFTGADRERFERLIQRPNGIFLVTGPTGSGKTTTLYAALRHLNKSDVKIITAEDPVEYHISGINQCQVKHQIGLDFSRILRAMLRQAPNIILVGEIRDGETAEIAIQAALTGHLVFSTLHTNDAPSALARLIDMGVKPFLVAASVQAVLAQRLVRNLCPSCKEAYQPTPAELRSIGVEEGQVGGRELYRARGCDACSGTGYMGRSGIFELMVMDDEIRERTFRRESTIAIRRYAEQGAGMFTLLRDGARKFLEGRTSIDEVFRVVAMG
ncbi:MAG: GspE/PulE family protein [Planctomycetota bacterium]